LFISATKVSIEKKMMLTTDEITKLQGLYTQMLGPALDIYRKDKAERGKKFKNKKQKAPFFCFRFIR
jgi:hypothetical protein